MKLKTIWTIPAMSKKERLRRTREWAAQLVAAKLPKRIRYWVTIQEISRATADSPNDIMLTPVVKVLLNLEYPA